MATIESIQTDAAPAAIGPYSQGVRCGDFLFLSGQIPLTAAGDLVEGDAATQARQVFRNIEQVLKAGGASLHQVVKATVFLASMDDFQAVNTVYAEAFGEHRPARSAVAVKQLPRAALVEIEVIAYVR
ncbi:MAG: Rid family detoxifying hydrolase [Firmicutes bacterium]|nr:Rid family detoxifying hydrolase [Bacillota bacterium]